MNIICCDHHQIIKYQHHRPDPHHRPPPHGYSSSPSSFHSFLLTFIFLILFLALALRSSNSPNPVGLGLSPSKRRKKQERHRQEALWTIWGAIAWIRSCHPWSFAVLCPQKSSAFFLNFAQKFQLTTAAALFHPSPPGHSSNNLPRLKFGPRVPTAGGWLKLKHTLSPHYCIIHLHSSC